MVFDIFNLCEVLWMLVQIQEIIDLLESELDKQGIEYYNEFTFQESRIKRDTYRKVIKMIRDLENKEI
jgi:hypothetical protein